jgi:beta-1,2-mannobiose phosphorylase / 1,2-beta-oligomannan phosphorylase
MGKIFYTILILICLGLCSCKQSQNKNTKSIDAEGFAKEMVEFTVCDHNPLFSGTNIETWDKHIRERGFILADEGIYKMWYTGYTDGDNDPKYLGYATSADGIDWVRYDKNPIFNEKWTEDMFVMKYDGIYYMFAEGENDVSHLLKSSNGINWEEKGDLIIISSAGDTISGPYGTPSVIIENEKWYLYYERNDEAVWLATSDDQLTWINVQDEPVLMKGPETYDSGAVASNQIVKFNGKYYMYYHGTTDSNWSSPDATSIWTSNVAISSDLINWIKYPANPIVEGDHSSPVLVYNGSNFRLYTMHDKVCLFNPR